jgi:hypothetical protein
MKILVISTLVHIARPGESWRLMVLQVSHTYMYVVLAVESDSEGEGDA